MAKVKNAAKLTPIVAAQIRAKAKQILGKSA